MFNSTCSTPRHKTTQRTTQDTANAVAAQKPGIAHAQKLAFVTPTYAKEAQIEAERKEYYFQLEAAQRGELDITRWLSWFLSCLGRAIEAAEGTLAAVRHKAELWRRINRDPVNERQSLEATGAGGFEDVSEGQAGSRREPAVCGQVHRSLDLNPGKTWRLGTFKEPCELVLEVVVDAYGRQNRVSIARNTGLSESEIEIATADLQQIKVV